MLLRLRRPSVSREPVFAMIHTAACRKFAAGGRLQNEIKHPSVVDFLADSLCQLCLNGPLIYVHRSACKFHRCVSRPFRLIVPWVSPRTLFGDTRSGHGNVIHPPSSGSTGPHLLFLKL